MSETLSPLNGVESVDTKTEINSMLAAALDYASRGWRVFPLKPNDKVPMTSHGCKDATTDIDIIRQWWEATPNANIGIATGSESGLLILDNDAYKGGDETLATMTAKYGPL